MKTLSILFGCVLVEFFSTAMSAQSEYSTYAVGYVNYQFLPGDNLFGIPVQPSDGLDNALVNQVGSLFENPPDGTTLSIWNPAARAYDQTSVYSQVSGWSKNLTLNLGQGALLHTPSAFVNTFVGDVMAPDGTRWALDTPLSAHLPQAYAGPGGLYLLSSKAPLNVLSSPDYPVFTYILGRDPRPGEQVTWLDAATQIYETTTFSGGHWDNGDPTLTIGGAAFFNLGSESALVAIPEPTTVSLGLFSMVILVAFRRWFPGGNIASPSRKTSS